MKQLLADIALIVIICIIVLGVAVTAARAGGMPENNASTESNQITERIRNNVPVPQLQTSSERKNVAKRAEIFNNEEKISYIYLVDYGKVMAFYTVQGKVSSLRSYMTPVEQMVDRYGNPCTYSGTDYCGEYGYTTISAPDIDGTYGENVEGIFFFTTEGAYVEWRGNYMMSDQPLKLVTPPALVREID